MGRKYGTSTGSGGRKYGGGTQDFESLLAGKEVKPKVGALTRVGNVLSAFEPGDEAAALLKTGDPARALGQYFSEVGRGLGSAIPALDKYTKPVELAAGRKGFSEALKVAGVPEGEVKIVGKRLGSLRGLAGLGLDIVADPGNLLLAGMFKGFGKAVGKTGKIVEEGLAKSEHGQEVLRASGALKDALGEMFVSGYKAKKVSPELVEFTNRLKRATNVGDLEAARMVKGLVDKYGLEEIKKVPYEIENMGLLKKAAKKSELNKFLEEAKKKKFESLPSEFPTVQSEATKKLQLQAEKLGMKTEEAAGRAGLAKETRGMFTNKEISLINRFKKVATSRAFREGDLETLRKLDKNNVVESTIQTITDKGLAQDESGAIEYALNLPTLKQTRVPRVTITPEEKLLRVQALREAKLFESQYGTKLTKAEMRKAESEYMKQFRAETLKKKSGIPPAIPEPAGPLSEAARDVMNLVKEQTAGEVTRGLRKTSIDYYFPRKVVKEPVKPLYPQPLNPLRPTLRGAEKGRVFETLKQGEEAGFKYTEAPQSLTLRLATSQRAQKVKGALDKMVAGEVKDVAGNPAIVRSGTVEGFKDFTLKSLKGYSAHPDIVDYMERVQKVFGNEDATNKIIKIYDNLQNIWKGSVTSIFPAFHVRNALSNVFNNWVAGVKDPTSYLNARTLQKGTGVLTEELKKLIPGANTFEEARRILGELGVTGEGQFAVESVGKFEELIGKTGISKKLAEAPRNIGRAIEDNARIAHYVEKVGSGLSPTEAVKSVNKFLFDYSDLSKFESEVIKRVFPFYTFSRKNIPLQLEQIAKQPIKYKAVFDTVRAFQSGDLTPEEKKYMPDYLNERLGINIGRNKSGMPQILSGLGLPVEDLGKLGNIPKSLMELLSPAVKIPFEKASGQSFFYGKPIKDTSAYYATTKTIGNIPILKDYLQAVPTKDSKGNEYYKVNPDRMYNLKSIIGRVITTGEKITDTRFSGLMKLLNSVTGAKIYTPDLEKEKEIQLKKMLLELGELKTFTKEYVPKSKTGFGRKHRQR